MALGKVTGKRLTAAFAILVVLLLLLATLAPAALAGPNIKTPGVPAPGAIWGDSAAPKGVVAVSQPLAAKAGALMLAKGGNAIDAAAAIQFALNVEEPMMTGIGGGNFMMIYLADQKQVVVLDGREFAPANAKADQFMENGKPMDFNKAVASGLSVGVPGTLLGTATALKRYGTMSLAEVMAPAVKMADDGITVTPFLADSLAGSVAKLSVPESRAYTFLHDDGTPLKAGELLVQKDLAKTFRLIAQKGTDVYYNGEIGQAVAAIVQARGGPMQFSDLQAYKVKDREPVRGTYRGWEVVSMPPPSSGGSTIIQTLMMLERFPIGQWGHNSVDTLSVTIEALRLAYADRAKYLGDSDFVNVPLKGLLNPAYVATRSALIDKDQAKASVVAGDPWPYNGGGSSVTAAVEPGQEGKETTHFVVADRWGNVVSWTTTIESGWGSGIMVPGYGFLLNNEMTDFDFTPGGANQVEPFKRPRSSMSPTILLKDGKPWMATGSPGGSTIINTVLQVIMNVVDHGMTVAEAVEAPRISRTSASLTANTSYENGVAKAVRDALVLRGHKNWSGPTIIGSAQSLVIDLQTGRVFAKGDSRRNGTVYYVKGGEDWLLNEAVPFH